MKHTQQYGKMLKNCLKTNKKQNSQKINVNDLKRTKGINFSFKIMIAGAERTVKGAIHVVQVPSLPSHGPQRTTRRTPWRPRVQLVLPNCLTVWAHSGILALNHWSPLLKYQGKWPLRPHEHYTGGLGRKTDQKILIALQARMH